MSRPHGRDLTIKRKVIDINKKAIVAINEKSFSFAQNLLKEANNSLEDIVDKNIIKRLSSSLLNTSACMYHKDKRQDEALQVIDKVLLMEKDDPIEIAKTLLNKCAILSDCHRYQQTLKLAIKVNKILSGKNLLLPDRFGRQTARQLFIISFLTIASQHQNLNRMNQALEYYKKGLQACRTWIGQKHQLTTKMKDSLKNIKTKHFYHQNSFQQSINQQTNFRIRQIPSKKLVEQPKQRQISDIQKKIQQILSVYQPKIRSKTLKARRSVNTQPDQMIHLNKIKKLYKPIQKRQRFKTQIQGFKNRQKFETFKKTWVQ